MLSKIEAKLCHKQRMRLKKILDFCDKRPNDPACVRAIKLLVN